GAHQPPDRRAALPGREDGQELRVQPPVEAGDVPAHRGRRLRRPAAGTAAALERGLTTGRRVHRARRHRGLWLGLSVTLVIAAACGDDDGSASTTTAPTNTPPPSTSTTATPGTNPAEQTEVRSYLLRDEVVGPVARTAEAPAVARGAMDGLLAGPTDEEDGVGFSTAIPA